MLKRIDEGFARGEAAIAAVVLLSMIVVAAFDTIINNAAIRLEWEWAIDLSMHRPLVHVFLQRSTIVLAFLGASLATHHDKHIAIDVLSHLVPRKVFAWIRTLVTLVAGIISFMLALVFYKAALGPQVQRLSLDYSILLDGGSVHICDAPAFAVDTSGVARPDLWCGVRSMMESIGVHGLGEPSGLFRLIVPVMLVVIAIRMIVKALTYGHAAINPSAYEPEPETAGSMEADEASPTAAATKPKSASTKAAPTKSSASKSAGSKPTGSKSPGRKSSKKSKKKRKRK